MYCVQFQSESLHHTIDLYSRGEHLKDPFYAFAKLCTQQRPKGRLLTITCLVTNNPTREDVLFTRNFLYQCQLGDFNRVLCSSTRMIVKSDYHTFKKTNLKLMERIALMTPLWMNLEFDLKPPKVGNKKIVAFWPINTTRILTKRKAVRAHTVEYKLDAIFQ